MLFEIDPTSAVPIYAQIAEQVKHAIASGLLHPGDALPSRRDLSVRLRINPLTVTKAYQELESEGVVVTEHGRGTFIALHTVRLEEDYRQQELTQAIDRMLVAAYHLGATPDEILRGVEQRLSVLQEGLSADQHTDIPKTTANKEDAVTNG